VDARTGSSQAPPAPRQGRSLRRSVRDLCDRTAHARRRRSRMGRTGPSDREPWRKLVPPAREAERGSSTGGHGWRPSRRAGARGAEWSAVPRAGGWLGGWLGGWARGAGEGSGGRRSATAGEEEGADPAAGRGRVAAPGWQTAADPGAAALGRAGTSAARHPLELEARVAGRPGAAPRVAGEARAVGRRAARGAAGAVGEELAAGRRARGEPRQEARQVALAGRSAAVPAWEVRGARVDWGSRPRVAWSRGTTLVAVRRRRAANASVANPGSLVGRAR